MLAPTAEGLHVTRYGRVQNYASNFRSDHPGGCNFLMADGSATFLPESIDMVVYQAKSTIAGEEVISE